jgi:hypothetical protein
MYYITFIKKKKKTYIEGRGPSRSWPTRFYN